MSFLIPDTPFWVPRNESQQPGKVGIDGHDINGSGQLGIAERFETITIGNLGSFPMSVGQLL